MAEICIGLVVSAITEIGKYLVVPISRQFNYLCCFHSNIQSLNLEAQKLEAARAKLQELHDVAYQNARDPFPEVQTLLENIREYQEIKMKIDSEIPNVQKSCVAIPSRFSLSRKVKRTVESMEKLCNSCSSYRDFNDVSVARVHPASTQPVLLEQTNEFQSRKEIEEAIMTALREKKVNMVGVCGMGGIGKTTMAKKVMDRVREEKLFDEAVMAVVSQTVEPLKIQQDIAELLGLTELKNLENIQARANILSARLNGAKRILVVLDDVWKKVDLVELGICCTVLFTSRALDVLKQMNVEVFSMKILSEGEAWNLFKDKAGECAMDPNLSMIAKKVAKECQGLPLALVTIGATLKGQERNIWEDALNRLENANSPSQFKDEVHDRLRISYDFLKEQEEKSLFLLCSSFPEDYNIYLEDLTLYSMGLNMLERVETLQQARNRVYAIVKVLKSRFLLLGSDNNEIEVKMHDVIRDLAISIAFEKRLLIGDRLRSKNLDDRNCEWMALFPESSDDNSLDRLKESNFPNLRLLIIHYEDFLWRKMEINDLSFLEGMQRLNVLSFKFLFNKSPQRVIHFAKNLRILRLDGSNLMTLSLLGGLLNLEVLSCCGCDKIKEVMPSDIGGLKCLKLLDLSDCTKLRKIAPRTLSKLVELEELKIWNSFREWESGKFVNDENRRNVSLKELESLQKLVCLEIGIRDESLAEEDICLSSSLIRYKVEIGETNFDMDFWSYEKIMILHPRANKFGSWIQNLVKASDMLYFEGNGLRSLHMLHACKDIKILKIESSQFLEKLVDSSTMPTCAFSLLKDLVLYKLPNLMQICDGPIPRHISFRNLSTIDIYECNQLQNLMLLEAAEHVCPELKRLTVDGCEKMKQVFISNEKVHLTLPKLMHMRLTSLPNLTSFSKGIESIEFPSLWRLVISKCSAMEWFVCPTETRHKSPYLFFNQKVKFGVLLELKIVECNNISTLFSLSMARNLASLQFLYISSCKNMKHVIATDEQIDEILVDKCEKMKQVSWKKENKETVRVTFPKLQKLCLTDLSSLTSFGKGIDGIELPMLVSLQIDSCSLLENSPLFDNEKVNFGELSTLRIKNCHNIRNLFSGSIVDNLERLKCLTIRECRRMKTVIADEKEKKHASSLLFPSLETLHLERLPMLLMFCGWECSLELPHLITFSIAWCRRMESLTHGSLTTPKLKKLKLENKWFEVEDAAGRTHDLSTLVHQLTKRMKGRKTWRRFKGQSSPTLTLEDSSEEEDCEITEPTTTVEKKMHLENLSSLIANIWSNDASKQLEAATQFCKLLSQDNSPIQEVIQSGVVPKFVEFFKRDDTPQLQLEAAWALTRIALGSSEHREILIDNGVVPILVELLSSPGDDVRKQAALALGHLADDYPYCRDLALIYGALHPLLALLNDPTDLPMLRVATSTLLIFCGGIPEPVFEQLKPALPVLAQLIHTTDEEVLENTCWALSYLCRDTNDGIQAVIDSGVVPRLVELLLHPAPSVSISALSAVTNVASGDDVQTQCIVDHNALPCLLNLLSGNYEDSIKKYSCKVISSITAGNSNQIQSVIEANLVGPLVQLLQNVELDLKEAAARAISKATIHGTHEQIKYLVSQQCIKPLCDMLPCPNPKAVRVCLKGLARILKAGEAKMNDGQIGDVSNHYAQMIEDAGGLEKIENLQNHKDDSVRENAVLILEEYWVEEEEDEETQHTCSL